MDGESPGGGVKEDGHTNLSKAGNLPHLESRRVWHEVIGDQT